MQLMATKQNLDLFSLALLTSQIGVLEEGLNRGPAVELYQRAVAKRGERNGLGSAVGEPWCAAFVQWVILTAERAYGVKSRVHASELCIAIYANSPKDLRLAAPEPGALIVWQVKDSIRGHIEWVVGVNPDGTVRTIGGNTGPDTDGDVIDQGDGVYFKKKVNIKGTEKKPVIGFLKVWE